MARFVKKHPVIVAGGSTCIRYILGDTVVQLSTKDKDEEFNYIRTLCFALFGYSYASTIGYRVYNCLYPALGWSPLRAALADVFVQMPVLYFPLFYAWREFALSDPTQWTKQPLQIVQNGLSAFRHNLVDDVVLGAKFWIPAHIINFKYVPIHYRQPFIGVIGFAWAMILSCCSFDDEDAGAEKQPSLKLDTSSSGVAAILNTSALKTN